MYTKEDDFYFGTKLPTLSDADFIRAAKRLGLQSTAAIRAVARVEGGGRSGFNKAGYLVVLPEAHIFNRITKSRWLNTYITVDGKRYPLATTNQKLNVYPVSDATRYAMIVAMCARDEDAALQSVSWGMFQMMGFNYRIGGYSTVQQMLKAFGTGEGPHLDAFVSFCLANKLDDEIRDKRFEAFAAVYNGPTHKESYGSKLQTAYETYFALVGNDVVGASAKPAPVPIERRYLGEKGSHVSELQKLLIVKVESTLPRDGNYGPRTMNAVTALRGTGYNDEALAKLFSDLGFKV